MTKRIYDRMTYEQFGVAIGFSKRTVLRLVKEKILHPRQFEGGRKFFLPEDVESFKKRTSGTEIIHG